jgi:hypothetical protein
MDDAVRIVTTAETPTAVVTETTSWEELPQVWPALLAELSRVPLFRLVRDRQR